ncbi:MAG: hypothetical protein RBR97_17415 [Bacteroidales bacterium]|nr:hypothetical protein [Bacteroidales bacterium]
MAIQKELWADMIQEELRAKLDPLNDFALDLSEYAEGTTIHIPVAGATQIVKDNTNWPLTATQRTDTVVDIILHTYHWTPMVVKQADKVQLAYDKMASLYNSLNGGLGERLLIESLIGMYHYTSGAYVTTTGASYPAHAPGATGNRRGLTSMDIRKAAALLDKQKVPIADRWLVVDSIMFWQLVDDLAYNADRVDVVAGLPSITTPLYGFTVVSVPQVVYLKSDGTIRAYGATGETTDKAAALAIQKSCVGFGMSGIEIFVDDGNPLYQGDILSGWVLHGSNYLRTTKEGVIPIIQATV